MIFGLAWKLPARFRSYGGIVPSGGQCMLDRCPPIEVSSAMASMCTWKGERWADAMILRCDSLRDQECRYDGPPWCLDGVDLATWMRRCHHVLNSIENRSDCIHHLVLETHTRTGKNTRTRS